MVSLRYVGITSGALWIIERRTHCDGQRFGIVWWHEPVRMWSEDLRDSTNAGREQGHARTGSFQDDVGEGFGERGYDYAPGFGKCARRGI